MNLDSLFQHILLTEQQAQERRRLIQEVKSETSSCHDKIREVTVKFTEAKTVLENKVECENKFLIKVCLLSEKIFQRDLLLKRHDVLTYQKDALLKEKQEVLDMIEKVKKKMADEEEKFMKEVMDFNSCYGLTSNREILIREQVKAETEQLKKEAETLRKEMKSVECENVHLNNLQLQKSSLKRELQDLTLALKEAEDKISDAISTTKRLESEKFKISQKPQSDAECIRLKKELEAYKEDDLENVYEALRMEIEFLQAPINAQSSAALVSVYVKSLLLTELSAAQVTTPRLSVSC
ncbi:coiled-coil domain-containing protein 172 [Discoglossus pictus]